MSLEGLLQLKGGRERRKTATQLSADFDRKEILKDLVVGKNKEQKKKEVNDALEGVRAKLRRKIYESHLTFASVAKDVQALEDDAERIGDVAQQMREKLATLMLAAKDKESGTQSQSHDVLEEIDVAKEHDDAFHLAERIIDGEVSGKTDDTSTSIDSDADLQTHLTKLLMQRKLKEAAHFCVEHGLHSTKTGRQLADILRDNCALQANFYGHEEGLGRAPTSPDFITRPSAAKLGACEEAQTVECAEEA